jgi:hypothetical protein
VAIRSVGARVGFGRCLVELVLGLQWRLGQVGAWPSTRSGH